MKVINHLSWWPHSHTWCFQSCAFGRTPRSMTTLVSHLRFLFLHHYLDCCLLWSCRRVCTKMLSPKQIEVKKWVKNGRRCEFCPRMRRIPRMKDGALPTVVWDVAGYALMRRTERQLGSWWKERPSAHSILNWPWPYQFVLAAICGLLCHAGCCLLMCHRLPSENSHGLGKWNLNRVGTCWYDGTECGSRQCSRCCEDSKLCIVPLCSTKLHADLSTHFFKSKYPHALADVWDYMICMLQDHYVVSR